MPPARDSFVEKQRVADGDVENGVHRLSSQHVLQIVSEVDWEDHNDKENPRNWSTAYKAFVLLTISWTTLMVVVGASAYTSGIPQMASTFTVSTTIPALGITTYLLGWVFGSLVLAPISELYGRRHIYLVTTAVFIVLLIPCALSKSLVGVIVARFFASLAGSGVIALSPGTIGDIANDEQRALAYSIWSLGPLTAPAVGPIVGGFLTQYLGWRWISWIVMAGTAPGFILLFFVKESYAPVLLRRKAAWLRNETGDMRWHSRFDNPLGLSKKLRSSLTRPLVLALTEPVLVFWNLYIGLIYGITYLNFTAYPVVFSGIRGWSVSFASLSFIGLAVGSLMVIAAEPFIRRLIARYPKDPATGKPPPESSIVVVCVAGLLIPAGQFWFAWTAAPPRHWVLPILAGIPYGMGATANFIYALNYLAYSYGIYAASIMAGNTVWRCVLGGALPLAGAKMFEDMGPGPAGSVLGGILGVMAPVPFLFWKFGPKIRGKSKVIKEAREEERRLRGR